MRGKAIGSKGQEGIVFSKQDAELSRRRYKKYIELTKGKEVVPPLDDLLSLLPLNGGSKQACGHTRFEHVQTESCKDFVSDRCHRVLKNGRLCGNKIGHTRACKSEESIESGRASYNRRQREARARRKEAV